MSSAPASPTPEPDASFPPRTLAAFLACCAGDWLSLRSLFQLEAAGGEEDRWHSSERGELVVAYLAPEAGDGPGALDITPPGGGRHRLLFQSDGGFQGSGPDGTARSGRWQLWPDGSLELVLEVAGATVRERIWFTKANLRLRSSVEHRADGSPARASFSSEIRRVRRPSG